MRERKGNDWFLQRLSQQEATIFTWPWLKSSSHRFSMVSSFSLLLHLSLPLSNALSCIISWCLSTTSFNTSPSLRAALLHTLQRLRGILLKTKHFPLITHENNMWTLKESRHLGGSHLLQHKRTFPVPHTKHQLSLLSVLSATSHSTTPITPYHSFRKSAYTLETSSSSLRWKATSTSSG